MAERIPLTDAEVTAAKEKLAGPQHFEGWVNGGLAADFRASREAFLRDGGLPDAPPDVAKILDAALEKKSVPEILDTLMTRLNSDHMFIELYREMLTILYSKGKISEADYQARLHMGETLATAHLDARNVLTSGNVDPTIEEALKTL